MASKKKTVVLPQPSGNADAEVVVSARMSAQQKELVERASEILGWSPAKLVREAAVRRAVDVINASDRAEIQLRALAARLVSQIVNPRATVTLRDDVEERTVATVEVTAVQGRFVAGDPHLPDGSISDVMVLAPSPGDRLQMRTALKEAGSRFVEMLLTAWDAADGGMGEFRPQISTADMLGESDGGSK